jgi:hypothetical protein
MTTETSPSPAPAAATSPHSVQLVIPGMQAVTGAALELAAANMTAFVEAVRERARIEGDTRGYIPHVGEPIRNETADADGRFGCPVRQRPRPGHPDARRKSCPPAGHLPLHLVPHRQRQRWWRNDAASMTGPIPPRTR